MGVSMSPKKYNSTKNEKNSKEGIGNMVRRRSSIFFGKNEGIEM
jgi:hypothetical protein